MSKCNISETLVIDYVYGELELTQTSKFENHLTTCNKCTRMVAGYNRVLRTVDDAENEYMPHVIVPRNLETKLYKRLADAQPDRISLLTRLSNYFAKLLLVMHEQKIASACLFSLAVITVVVFVGNPFTPSADLTLSRINSANARIEQYRHQDIQRNFEDVLRKKHLRNTDSLDTVSHLNRVKDQAQGTDWVNIANNHLERVHSEF